MMRSTAVGTGWVVFVTILVIPFFLSTLTRAAEDAQPSPTDQTVQDSAATFADSLSLTSRKDPIQFARMTSSSSTKRSVSSIAGMWW